MNREHKIKNGSKKGFSPLMAALFVLLIVYALLIIFPLAWGLGQSLMDGMRLDSTVVPWPSDWQFSNYIDAFVHFYVPVQAEQGTVYPTLVYMFGYSFVYAVGSALTATFVQCIVAYLTSRFNYIVSRIINVFVLIAIALPIVGSLPSEIQMAQALGLYDTLFGIWIMKGHFISIYYLVFYARFKTFSRSYEEAAQIDGAGNLRILFSIMLPLIKNLFWTIFLIQFIAFWNDYYTPLVYMPTYPTVAYGLWYYNQSTENALTLPMKVTGCILMLLPVLVLFAVFSKRLMSNLTMGGEKE